MTTAEPTTTHLQLLVELDDEWTPIMARLDEITDEAMRRHPTNVPALASYLKFLGEVRRAAQAAENSLARRMADAVKNAPPEARSIPNVGTVDVRPGTVKHRYDNPRLVGIVAARAAEQCVADPNTGEVRPPSLVAQHACALLADVAGITTDSYAGWRKGAAEKLGIRLNEHRNSEYSDSKAILL